MHFHYLNFIACDETCNNKIEHNGKCKCVHVSIRRSSLLECSIAVLDRPPTFFFLASIYPSMRTTGNAQQTTALRAERAQNPHAPTMAQRQAWGRQAPPAAPRPVQPPPTLPGQATLGSRAPAPPAGAAARVPHSVVPAASSERIVLYRDNRERAQYEDMAAMFALIICADRLESAWARRSAVETADYEREITAIINKYRTVKSAARSTVPDVGRFYAEYISAFGTEAELGKYRLIDSGRPGTDEAGLHGTTEQRRREQSKFASQCTQLFITLQDNIELKLRTVESILPDAESLMKSLDRLDALGTNCVFRQRLDEWVRKMNSMYASDELSDDDAAQFKLHLDLGYTEFYNALDS